MIKSLALKTYRLIFIDFLFRYYFHDLKLTEISSQTELHKFFERAGIIIKVVGSPPASIKSPSLLISNHNTWFDAIIIFSVVGGENSKLWAAAINQQVFVGFKEKLIPVSSSGLIKQSFPGNLKAILATAAEATKNVKEMNTNAIVMGIDQLESNQNLLVFPSGGTNNWFPGVGYICAHFIENKTIQKDIYIRNIYLSGVSEFDLIWHGFKRKIGIPSQLVVKFKLKKSFRLSDVSQEFAKSENKKDEAKQITKTLQQKYLL